MPLPTTSELREMLDEATPAASAVKPWHGTTPATSPPAMTLSHTGWTWGR